MRSCPRPPPPPPPPVPPSPFFAGHLPVFPVTFAGSLCRTPKANPLWTVSPPPPARDPPASAAPSANFVTMWTCLPAWLPGWLSNYLISVFVCQLMFTNLLTPLPYQCVCSAVNNIRNTDEPPVSQPASLTRRTPCRTPLSSSPSPHLSGISFAGSLL